MAQTGHTKRKIEGLAEAIIAYSSYIDPGSDLHAARNPGGLKALGMIQARDDKGNRVFRSVLDGLQALLFDITLKISGESRAKLKPTATLTDLALAYNLPATTAQAWSRFLRKSLRNDSLTANTPLSYFQEQ